MMTIGPSMDSVMLDITAIYDGCLGVYKYITYRLSLSHGIIPPAEARHRS
jgi:hypothetical protein